MLAKLKNYFSPFELLLWTVSVILITLSFLIFDRANYLTLIASVIGITSLIFGAKGNPVSQILMIVFSLLYGAISLSFAYYGEMITYLGMTLPMAVFSLVQWLKNPFKGKKSEVAVNRIHKKEVFFILFLTVLVTFIFHFILKALNTANLFFSTLSVTTSFAAAYLTARRSPYFAFVYAANDLVLIILWTYAAFFNTSYLSVVICFLMFMINDSYCFLSWKKMQKQQEMGCKIITAHFQGDRKK